MSLWVAMMTRWMLIPFVLIVAGSLLADSHYELGEFLALAGVMGIVPFFFIGEIDRER